MVILSNARFVHPFLAAVKQKFLELTFGAKPCSDQMINTMLQDRENAIKKNHETVSVDSKDTAWIASQVGLFASNRLGAAKLSKTNNGKEYEMEFQEWKSRVGSETEKNGKKFLVLVDPPFDCEIKLLVE